MAYLPYQDAVSFTPTIIGSSSAGIGTYSIQQGWYTQIGNMIMCAIELQWSAHTGTGDLWIGNLPFTIRNLANYSPEGIVNTQNLPLPGSANRTSIGSGQENTTHMIVVVSVNNSTNSPVQMSSSGIVHATLNYLK